MTSLNVAIAGVCGVLARYFVGVVLSPLLTLPLPTFVVNISGAFLAGGVAAITTLPDATRIPLAVGFLGGFTTFSAYTVETLRLWQEGQLLRAAGYAVASPVIGLLAAAAGMWLGRRL